MNYRDYKTKLTTLNMNLSKLKFRETIFNVSWHLLNRYYLVLITIFISTRSIHKLSPSQKVSPSHIVHLSRGEDFQNSIFHQKTILSTLWLSINVKSLNSNYLTWKTSYKNKFSKSLMIRKMKYWLFRKW